MRSGAPRETDRQQDERQLDAEQFRLLAASLTQQVFVVLDVDWTRILYANPAIVPLMERTVERWGRGREGFLSVVHENDRPRVRREGEACREAPRAFEFRLRDGDGQLRWLHCHGFPIRDGQGVVRRLGFVLEDRTVRRQAEALLDDVQRHVAGLARSAGDPFGVLRRALGLRPSPAPELLGRQSPLPLRPSREGFAQRAVSLTRREREVMEHLVAGGTTKNIAAALGLSRKTIEGYHTQVMRKMHVASVAELVRLALLARQRGAGAH